MRMQLILALGLATSTTVPGGEITYGELEFRSTQFQGYVVPRVNASTWFYDPESSAVYRGDNKPQRQISETPLFYAFQASQARSLPAHVMDARVPDDLPPVWDLPDMNDESVSPPSSIGSQSISSLQSVQLSSSPLAPTNDLYAKAQFRIVNGELIPI